MIKESVPSHLQSQQQPEAPPVEVPLQVLSSAALQGVIANFIEREGTDYGAVEVSYETKVQQIKKQLDEGDIKIIFDPNSQTVTLMTDRDWLKFSASFSNRQMD